MKFEDLRLAEPIVRAVAAEGYTHPTPIQRTAIPHALSGRDLLGCAQTGTGKTAAFALPILHRLHASAPAGGNRPPRRPRALVLCPTRELACQIDESVRTYGANLALRCAVIYGGVNQNPQVRALRAGAEIVVATPGRLLDLMQQGHVDLEGIEILVLDEADRMLDMGFINDIRRIVGRLPRARQTMLFSATMPQEIRALAGSILRDPVSVQVDPVASTASRIAQSVYFVPREEKPRLLQEVLRGEAAGRTLVFTRTKHGADKVVKVLVKAGLPASAIHGNKSQNARQRALSLFKSKSPPILVATDIASRGIDVDDIAHVINYDLPDSPETYVHRIGRTARAGAEGAAITFCDPQERGELRAIERTTGSAIAVAGEVAGTRRPRSDEAAPPQRRTAGNGAGRRDARAADRREAPRRAEESTRSKPAVPAQGSSFHRAGKGRPGRRSTGHASGGMGRRSRGR